MDEKEEAKEEVKEVKIKWYFPVELYKEIRKLPYLRHSTDYFIASMFHVILNNIGWPYEKVPRGKITSLLDYLYKYNNNDIFCEDKKEIEFGRLSVEFLLNLVCDIQPVEDGQYIIGMVKDKDRIRQKFESYKTDKRYEKWFNYGKKQQNEALSILQKCKEEVGSVWKPGMTFKDVEDALTEKARQANLSKKELGTDKRIKSNVDIIMIDVITGDIVNTYGSREEAIEDTGINKSVLSDCIRSCKDPNKTKWRKWKEKETGNRYYFKEKAKDKI